MQIPRLSVLLPLRNVAPWLRECLDSLVSQSLPDFEVLAVDDGSTDETGTIYRGYAERDSRFQLLPRQGSGLVDALNQAARAARAPWLARMDGDDICEAHRFEAQLQYLHSNQGLDVLGSLIRMFPEPVLPGMEKYQHWLNSVRTEAEIRDQAFIESPLAHPSVLIRKATLERLGGYQDRGWPEDYDLWLRILGEGGRIGKVPEVLLHWRDRPDRTSRQAAEYKAERFRACKLHYLRQRYPLQDGVVLLGAGATGKPWARLLLEEGLPVRHFLDLNPRRIGKSIDGIPVLAAESALDPRPTVFLAAVGKDEARAQVRLWFQQSGLADGQFLVFVA